MSSQATSTTQSSKEVVPFCDVLDWALFLGYGAAARANAWSFYCNGCKQQLTEEEAEHAATRREYANGCSCEQKCNTRHSSIVATSKDGTRVIYFK